MADGAIPPSIIVEPVSGPHGRKAFIAAGKIPYAGDPAYVAPLEFELAARLEAEASP